MHADVDGDVIVEDDNGDEDISGSKASMKWNKIAQDELKTVLKVSTYTTIKNIYIYISHL